jgi:phosphate transport system protein
VRETRHQFPEDLVELERQTLEGLEMVSRAFGRALGAIIDHDLELAAIVVAGDKLIDVRYLEVHQGLLLVLARQAPVAGDLRIVAGLLHVIRCIERMGDQCANIAKLVPLSDEKQRKDSEILELTRRMGALTGALVSDTHAALKTRHVSLARELVAKNLEVARCNRAIFSRAVEIGDELELREWAAFMILAARAIERVADNAAGIAEQTVFIVTGFFLHTNQPGSA